MMDKRNSGTMPKQVRSKLDVGNSKIANNMATPDVYLASETPDPQYSMVLDSPRLKPTMRETQESLKRSFERFLASDHGNFATGSLFEPSKHLAFEEPGHIHTMEDLGLPSTNGVSPVAVSDPFRLFSEEAINLMRKEILHPEVQKNYSYTSDIAPRQIRGYAPKYGKFIFEAWKHPQTLAIISKIAGVDVVPVMDYEIGHVNMSVAERKPQNKDSDTDSKAEEQEEDEEEEEAIVGWHRDSYPFVCVLMMSDTTGMVGGETALRTGNGDIKKVRGPSKGFAVVLQGRYIDHQALRAFGGQERITMVTSFRPRNPAIRDDMVLTTVRPISNLPELYGQTIEYQLENAESRIREMLKKVRDSLKTGATDIQSIKGFLDFEVKTLAHLNTELVDESKVEMGALAEVCKTAGASKRRKMT